AERGLSLKPPPPPAIPPLPGLQTISKLPVNPGSSGFIRAIFVLFYLGFSIKNHGFKPTKKPELFCLNYFFFKLKKKNQPHKKIIF
ncbi:hypothetical protein ACVGWR_00110, partial [Enterobacter hormaechei]